MTPNYNFRQDLPVAQKTEYEVARLLCDVYKADARTIEMCHDNRYDIKAFINNGWFTFEVKEDFTCERTGNVGVEYSCRGKPSGIAVSQADFYIYKIHSQEQGIVFLIFSTKHLKALVDEKLYFRTVNGGDAGSDSLNYLFKYNTFVANGKVLK